MRYEQNGVSIWYATPDVPAPEGDVVASPSGRATGITVTVAVQPIAARNTVEVRYRVNGGPEFRAQASLARTDVRANAQYFVASLPEFRVGDTVEYGAVCNCAGRQVPGPESAGKLASSFRVVPAAALSVPHEVLRIHPMLAAGPRAVSLDASDELRPVPGEVRRVSPSGDTIPHPSEIERTPRAPVPQPAPGPSVAGTKASDAAGFVSTRQQAYEGLISPTDPASAGVGVPSSSPTATIAPPAGASETAGGPLPPPAAFLGTGATPSPPAGAIGPSAALSAAAGELLPTPGAYAGAAPPIQAVSNVSPSPDQTNLLRTVIRAASVLDTGALEDKFLGLYANRQGRIQNFWAGLKQDPDLKDYVGHLQFALQLGLLTQNHAPLIQTLQTTPGVASTRDLIKLDDAAWSDLVGKTGVPPGVPGSTAQEQAANYAHGIMSALRAAFPTDAVAQIAAKAPNASPLVSKFFANSPDFDIRKSHVDKYASENSSAAFNGIADADRPKVLQDVKRLQRLFQVSANPDTLNGLLSTGLNSAHAIGNIPRNSFLAQHAPALGGPQQAAQVYDRAQFINARNVHLRMAIQEAMNGVRTRAFGDPGSLKDDLIKRFPNYTELFGSLELCDCQECKSVLGAPAYLVDLLEFLGNSTPNASGNTPLDVLIGNSKNNVAGRRPDLAYVPLTCENTNTTMPYVDLVNEVLESYIALGMSPDASAAHDTARASAQELDANPQYTNNDAYQMLQQEVYPFTLPFNRPLAVARAYLKHLGSSRYEIISAFQKDQAASVTQRGLTSEYLGLAAEEYQILTGQSFDQAASIPARKLWEFYGYTFGAAANGWKDSLAVVPELLRRTGIAYTDLVALVTTVFLNPNYPQGDALDLFQRIPFSYATLARLAQANFANPDPNTLTALSNSQIDLPTLIAWTNANYQKINKLIVLDAPDAACNLAATRLQHVDGSLLDDSELSKLHRFIRLWCKLRWSIADVDRALAAGGASDITPDVLTRLAQIKQLQADLNVSNLQMLLSLWSPINARGQDSLYNKLFFNKSALNKNDPDYVTFQPGSDGSVLTAPALHIKDYIPPLLAALRVSAVDLDAIRADAHLDADDAPLNLANVSMLYRYVALAKNLKLRINDFIALKTLSGCNPFAGPGETLRFLSIVGSVRASGFVIPELNYLFRHLTSPPANLAPQATTILLLAKTLRDGLTQIGRDNIVVPDPSGDVTRAKLALLFEQATVNQTIAMINGSAVYTAPLANLPDTMAQRNPAKQVVSIDPTKVPASVAKKVSYDPKGKVLRFQGAMTTTEQSALLGGSADCDYQAAVNDLFQQPIAFVQNALSGFLDVQDPQIKLLAATAALDLSLTPVLLDQNGTPTTDPTKASTTAIASKFAYVLEKLLPYLVTRLSHALAKQTISDALKLDSAMAQALLETVLSSTADTSQRAMADLLALQKAGVTGNYFSSSDLTGTPAVQTDASIAFDGTTRTIATGMQSVLWSGMLLAPNNGRFSFFVRTNGITQLWLGDSTTSQLALDSTAGEWASGPISLKAGQLYYLRLEVTQLPAARAAVQMFWQSDSTPKAIIPSDNLYPGAVLDALGAAFTRLHKAALFVNTYKLSDRELLYLAAPAPSSTHLSTVDLNALPRSRDPSNAAQGAELDHNAPALFEAWRRVNDFVTLRNSLPRGEVSLVDVFTAISLNDAQTKLAQATGWDPHIISSLMSGAQGSQQAAGHGFDLGLADLQNEVWPARLQVCVRLIKRLGVSAAQLFKWASLDSDFGTLEGIAQDIKKTLQAKYDEQTWLTVAKPLNDPLRDSQRAALIAYLLPRMNLTDSNELFEYFLIDADMGVCMETSRVVQAISSVQLFVQRCLMNLEERADKPSISVSPSQIDSKQLEHWRKQYRVWQANRKVFLYPENWLESELRDDKSPFFKEFESELIQNELTADNAESAFRNYLEKLDQVARLEIMGMYWQDVDPDSGEQINTLHVFGRTFHDPHVYFYRRLLNLTTWTPWEKMQVDVQGDHLIPVIWNRRLYVFWPQFAKKPADSSQQSSSRTFDFSDPKKVNISTDQPLSWEVTLNWSEYKDGKWSSKQMAKQVLRVDASYFLDDDPSKYAHHHYVFKTKIISDANAHATDLLISLQLHYYWVDPGDVMIDLGAFEVGGRTGETISARPSDRYVHKAVLPAGAGIEAMAFSGSAQGNLSMTGQDLYNEIFLGKTPSRYRLLYPHQFQDFVLQIPFFYQDGAQTYFATPSTEVHWIDQVATSNAMSFPTAVISPMSTGASSPSTGSTTISASSSPARAQNAISWIDASAAGKYHWYMTPVGGKLSWVVQTDLHFYTFYHPFVGDFMKSLVRLGIPGLLTVENQKLLTTASRTDGLRITIGSVFDINYDPNLATVPEPHPDENVDFLYDAAYSLYNWELFFHAPLLIATRLTQNRRFADARTWFHYIFNPTDDSPNEKPTARYWKVLPFKTSPCDRIEDLLLALDGGDPILKQELDDWAKNPFQPFRIARQRLIAYQKNVFMKYLDNLIAWGDQLFGRDTMESVNEAEQLYILAADLLGPRPQRVPPRGKAMPETYASLKAKGGKLDAFSNAQVQLENEFPYSGGVSSDPNTQSGGLLGFSRTLYFCVPQNDKLLGYWDTVADRLFKIRNCMNIQGVVRQLPLFAPPIDPALLVRAAAQGVDLSSVLSDINAPLPNYRFSYMLQKALELCAECRSLGGAMLSALEKRDAEALAVCRATQETNIQTLMKQIKASQLEEAQDQVQALKKSRELAKTRYQYYQLLLTGTIPDVPDLTDTNAQNVPNDIHNIPTQQTVTADGTRLLQEEQNELDSSHSARDWQVQASILESLASVLSYIPGFSLGAEPLGVGSRVLLISGGMLGAAATAVAKKWENFAAQDTYDASHAGKMAGYFRRQQEWQQQSNLAAGEIMQIDQQTLAAKVRRDIADYELNTLYPLQLQNAQDIQDFLTNKKYTNQDLYGWMISDISTTYFQCYQMAYDLAKKAERAFRFERGLTDSTFIQFGYWDSLRKGLQSGERLYLALKQMEQAYLDQNKREYEIAKNISLMLHDPLALIALKQTGKCELFLPEALFDADYPGHYMRRLKSVGLTIPCVVGPYTSINCTLTLLTNKTRISSSVAAGQYAEDTSNDDPRFVADFAALQSITTSHAQSDSGMFELNFRDERYLPFEGAGAISRWRIELPVETNAFDFNTLADVVLHLKYTAREGGDILRNAASMARRALLADEENSPLARLFSLKHEFPSDWYRFLHPTAPNATAQALQMNLGYERFPFQFRGVAIQISQVDLFMSFKDPKGLDAYRGGTPLNISLTDGGSNASGALKSDFGILNGTPYLRVAFSAQLPAVISLTLSAAASDLKNLADAVDDLVMVYHYTVSITTPAPS
jgi:hypothetical protein